MSVGGTELLNNQPCTAVCLPVVVSDMDYQYSPKQYNFITVNKFILILHKAQGVAEWSEFCGMWHCVIGQVVPHVWEDCSSFHPVSISCPTAVSHPRRLQTSFHTVLNACNISCHVICCRKRRRLGDRRSRHVSRCYKNKNAWNWNGKNGNASARRTRSSK